MDLRSKRSRSKTPSIVNVDILREGHVEHLVARSTRRTTTSVVKSKTNKQSESLQNVYSSSSDITNPSISSKRTKKSDQIFTSDYSSEGEQEDISSSMTLSSFENDRNRILEDAKAVSTESTGITALGLYRMAKCYWNKYPKTDWTYSPFSKDRVEIAPGVVAMPNMSRRNIHSYSSSYSTNENINNYTNNHDSYCSDEEDSIFQDRKLKPHKLFTNHKNSGYYYKQEETTKKSLFNSAIGTTLTGIYRVISTFFWIVVTAVTFSYLLVHTSCLRLARIFHRITSRIMLLDTWLLQKKSHDKKTKTLIVLCLVPLLLFGAWWFLSGFGHQLYTVLTHSATVLPLFSTDTSTKITENRQQNRPNEFTPFSQSHIDEIVKLTVASIKSGNKLDNDQLVSEILSDESFRNVLNDKNKELNDKIHHQQTLIESLKLQLESTKEELLTKGSSFEKILEKIENDNSRYLYQLNRCCKKPLVAVETYVKSFLTELLNNPEYLKDQKNLHHWVRSELNSSLSNVTKYFEENQEKLLEKNVESLREELTNYFTFKAKGVRLPNNNEQHISSNLDDIEKIVRNVLTIYDADKTGLVDYAMEPMGGQIITTRCTETYHAGTAVVSILGVPLWYPLTSPRIVITPGINPGECFAFQNFPGLLVIKLATRVKIEMFSMEHISKLLVPNGKIDSAPKTFQVYGLSNENDKNGLLLGEYTYDAAGESVQFFLAQNYGSSYEYVELKITSNHGNPNYTCLYRFRVHGKVDTS